MPSNTIILAILVIAFIVGIIVLIAKLFKK